MKPVAIPEDVSIDVRDHPGPPVDGEAHPNGRSRATTDLDLTGAIVSDGDGDGDGVRFSPNVEAAFADLEELVGLAGHQRRAIEALREVRAAYERTGTDIVALRQVIADELCNPLTTVVAALDVVRSGRELSAEDRELLLDRAQRQARNLASLLDDLLHRQPFETFEGERAEVEPVDLAEVVADVLDDNAAVLAPDRVEVDIPSGAVAVTDRARLVRIVGNLVANAARHAAGGGVTVRIRREARSLVVEVADRGPGVDPTLADELFAPFARAATSSGLGLGLFLVRALACSLGGRAELADRDGGGTVARVVLPQQRADDDVAFDVTVNDLRAIRAVRGA